MARFQSLAIPDLEITNKVAYYKTRKIQLIFGVKREVGLFNFLVKERELYIKVKINDDYVVQTYQKVNNFEYDTNKSYGQYAVGKYEIYLPTIKTITSIKIEGSFDSSGEDSFFKDWNIINRNTVFSSLSLNSNKDGWDTNSYNNFYSLTYPGWLSIEDGPVIIQGIKTDEKFNIEYSNDYYYQDSIKIAYPALTFCGEKIIPSQIKINETVFELKSPSTTQAFFVFSGSTKPSSSKIVKNTTITFIYKYNGEEIKCMTKIFNTLSHFSNLLEKEQEKANLIIDLTYKTYEPLKIKENQQEKYITCSMIDGNIGFRSVNLLPLEPISNNNVFGSFRLLERTTTESKEIGYIQDKQNSNLLYSENSNSLTFQNLLLDENHTSTTDKTPGFIFNLDDEDIEYFLRFKVKSKFTDTLVNLDYLISKDTIDSSSNLVIMDGAISLDLGTDNKTNILNYNESLKINIYEDKIYIPDKQVLLSKLIEGKEDYKFILSKDGETITDLSYKNLASLKNTTSAEYTKNITLDAYYEKDGNNIGEVTLGPIRLGRTKPIKVSKCFISGNTLTYQLSDWGGDKTTTTNGNNFIPFKSSFNRTGQEKLTLRFFHEDENGTLTNVATITKYGINTDNFLENTEHSINLNELLKDQNNVDINTINRLSGTYNYSLDGNDSNQTVNLLTDNDNEKIEIINTSNNPTLSIREHGLIINGKAEQELTSILDDKGISTGKYFIEINALNNTDRFIFKYSNSDCWFEIFNSEGNICISTTNKAEGKDELETTSAYLKDILTLAKIT